MIHDVYINTIKDQIASGLYESLFQDRRDLVFLDIGANIGLVSIYAVPYCRRIVAVEPAPNTFLALQKNTRQYPIIECLCAALAPNNEPVDFFVNDINFTASSTVNTYGTKISVAGTTLDKILREYQLDHVDVLKCDSEGAEGESLDYKQIENAKNIVHTWFVETHNCPKTSWEHKLGTLVGNFARCGYQHMEINGMALIVRR